MEADRRRRIKDGKEFDHLFPPPSGIDHSVKQRADVEDTLKLIRKTVPQTLWQTREISKRLKGRNLDETCSNIWHFVYGHIQYKRDEEGVEQIRSPRRTWWERQTGVDCDCYTEFICSILMNLKIPHVARITKYPKKPPDVPRWQHIYPIVPRNGRLDTDLTNRDNYIVIDCVKDDYDDEQEFIECKDYDMRLDYLDGIDDGQETNYMEGTDDFQPDTVDLSDLAAVYDEDELGANVFKKIGAGIKTAAKKVATVAKKVGDEAGKGIRAVNRYANPATIALRNGFLVAMKINMKNVAGRLRLAYLTDEQAKQRGINPDALKKIRSVKDRAETIYWQAGGKKVNLKKAILGGKGNKDKKVPLSGLNAYDNDYADMGEYNIIQADYNDMTGLGELVTGAALTAASGAVVAVSTALKSIKGIFNNGNSRDEQAFQSETDNAGSEANLPANVSDDEDKLVDDSYSDSSPITIPSVPVPAPAPVYVPPPPPSNFLPPPPPPVAKVSTPPPSAPDYQQSNDETTTETSNSGGAESTQSLLPDSTASNRSVTTTSGRTTTALSPVISNSQNKSLFKKTTAWVKANPVKTLLLTGAVAGGTYFLVKTLTGSKSSSFSGGGLSGLPKHKRKRKKKNKPGRRNKIHRLNLL